jgi:hypothetical protein
MAVADKGLPPLTDAQIREGARPGESWATARDRLTRVRDRLASWPRTMSPCECVKTGSRYSWIGWVIDDNSTMSPTWCEVCEGDYTALDVIETDPGEEI